MLNRWRAADTERPWGEAPEVEDWDTLVERALAFEGDEHVPKLVLACADMARTDTLRSEWAMLYYAADTALTQPLLF